MSTSRLALRQIERPTVCAAAHEERWLLGLPSLWRFLDFVEECGIEGAKGTRAALTDSWRAANDYYRNLEHRECGLANTAETAPMPAGLAEYCELVRTHPHFRRTFDTLPTEIAMVPLELLIVEQRHVTWTFVEGLQRKLARSLAPEQLVTICLPLERSEAQVEARRTGSKRYVFRCKSTDFRFQEAALLEPRHLTGFEASGAITGFVGLLLGFGCNFLNVLRVGKRLLLNNGYHRACALRALGVTHAPCVIQTATRIDELAAVAKGEVVDDAEFYFESARPPLLKDYFDERIRTSVPIRPQAREIEINFEVKEYLVPE
jgi:hypothetical protein